MLVNLRADYIQWPSPAAMAVTAEAWKALRKFPDVVGALDGTLIKIPGPAVRRDSYIDRHGNPSMQLRAIANSNLLLIECLVGFQGAVANARVLRNSGIERKLDNGALPPQYHILGDSAYPFMPYLLSPFKEGRVLSEAKKKKLQ